MIKYFTFLVLLVSISSCSKKATLEEDYWETIEAGAYKFVEANVVTYDNGTLVSDSTITTGNSYLLLYTFATSGFYNELELYGDWIPPFLANYADIAYAWSMGNDDTRVGFYQYDASLNDFILSATLTIKNTGGKKQEWNLVVNSGTIYSHYTIKVERDTTP